VIEGTGQPLYPVIQVEDGSWYREELKEMERTIKEGRLRNTIMRNIGSAVGAQIGGSIIAAHVLASGLPQNAGFEIAFLISAGGAIVAALSVLLIPGRRREPAADMQPAAASA